MQIHEQVFDTNLCTSTSFSLGATCLLILLIESAQIQCTNFFLIKVKSNKTSIFGLSSQCKHT